MAKSSTSSKPAAGSSAANRAAIIARQTTGMAQGSAPISQPAAAVASGSSSVKPTLEFGSTLSKALDAVKSQPSPFNISAAQKSGATLPSGSGGSGLNFGAASDFSSTPLKSEGLQFGSELLKEIEAAKGKPSPFNIKAAQSNPSVQAQVRGISLFSNPAATGSQTTLKTTVTPPKLTPAPLSNTNVTLGGATVKNFTQYYNQNKGTGKTIDELRAEYEKSNGKAEAPKPEEPVIPVPKEEPSIPEPQAQVPNTVEGVQSAIMASLQPSQEEIALQARLDAETEALGQGLVDVEDRPVALPFITGMSSSLEKRSALRTAPLQNQLARLQNARLGKLQALQTQLGFKNDELTRNFQKTQNDFSNKVALATKGLRYDTATDKFYKDESLAGAETDPIEKAKLEQGLRKEYSDEAKSFQTVRDYYARMLEASKNPSAAGDIALIFSYMKVLDPTSVVREGEFATAANAGSVPDSVRNMWNKALTGERISVNRQDFMNQAGSIFSGANEQHQQRVKTYTAIANSAGVNPENVVTDLGLPDSISSLIGNQATGPQDFNTDLSAGGGSYPVATYPDVNSKVQSAVNDIKAGYSKKQVMDYYHLSEEQYLQLTKTL